MTWKAGAVGAPLACVICVCLGCGGDGPIPAAGVEDARTAAAQVEFPSARLSVGSTSALERVFVDEPHGFTGRLEGPIEIGLVRNETEGIQVVLFPTEDMLGVTVGVSDLTTPTGAALDGVEVRTVGHVNLLTPRFADSRTGWYPDPLLPDQAVDLSAGVPQSVLVSVRTEATTEPGTYSGVVSVTARDTVIRRELHVDVWDVTLPRVPRFKSANLADWGLPERMWPLAEGGASPTDDARLEDMLRLADIGFAYRQPPTGFLANGLVSWNQGGRGNTTYGFPTHDPSGDGTGDFDPERTDMLLDYMLERGVNHFFIAVTGNVWRPPGASERRRERLVAYLRDYREHLASRGLLDMAYVYNIDEPWGEEVGHAKRTFVLIREQVGTDVRVMQNTNQNNARIIPELLGFFDVLDINLGFHDVTEAARFRDTNPESFTEFWWNVNLWPDSRPNLFLEHPLIDARMIGPLSYAFGVDGFEYWGMLWPPGIGNYHPVRGDELRVDWDVDDRSLDGSLIYPAADRSIYPSLRLTGLRDGMEDVELLYLLADASPGHPLLEVPVARGLTDFDDDPATYLRFRRDVVAAIVEANRVRP
jgi:hypothetical protein